MDEDRRRIPTQTRSQATVDAILEAAAQVLVRDGLEGATTTRIAERAGVSVGTLYQYFPNKLAVFRAMRTSQVQQFGELLATMLASSADVSLEEAVGRFVRGYVAVICSRPDLARALAVVQPVLEADRWSSPIQRRATDAIAAWLAQRPEPIDAPELTAWMLVQLARSLTVAALVQHPEAVADGRFAEHVVALSMGYLRERMG